MDHPIVITYLLLAVTILVSVKAFADSTFKLRLLFNAHDVVHYRKWYRCFTHGFIHGDYAHLAFNMFGLYVFGRGLEKHFLIEYGYRGYFLYSILYLAGILFATLPALTKHKDNPGYNSLGASGAISAVIFAYVLVFPNAQLGLILIPGLVLPAYIFGPLYLVAEYFMAKRGGTGIAHDAHIAGAIFGIVFLILVDYNYLLNFFNAFSS